MAANNHTFFTAADLLQAPGLIELSLTQADGAIQGFLKVNGSHLTIRQTIQPGFTDHLTQGLIHYLDCFTFQNTLQRFKFQYQIIAATPSVEYPLTFNSICRLIEHILSPLRGLEEACLRQVSP